MKNAGFQLSILPRRGFGYRFKSAAIFNERIRQLVCPTSCACRADGCVQISRSPGPHRGRASATDSRGLAKTTSRMDRARRRVSRVRFLRGAPEAAPRNLCPVGAGRSCLTSPVRLGPICVAGAVLARLLRLVPFCDQANRLLDPVRRAGLSFFGPEAP